MKTEVIHVTPRLAREWLKRNSKNRPIRPSHVETLRASFARGEYVMTHQGIAFGDDGELVDGQHRLAAIALMGEEMSFPMLVSKGLEREAAFPVIDATQAKRTTADVLGIERGVGECANFFAKLYLGRTTSITPVYVQPFADFVSLHLPELTAFCGRQVKTWSSAPVRSAAVIASIIGDADYTKIIYAALVGADFNSMPPVAQAMFRAHMAGAVRAAQAYDIFARCLKVFDPKNQNLKKVQINDQARVIASVRALLDAEVFGKKKAATASRAAKSVSGANYRLEGL
jgi:hypothetical protein